MMHDVFISHASEDKADVARPLAAQLTSSGFRVWIDECELTVGDTLRRAIEKGLNQSRFGIVILSEAFFAKEWPQKELDALVARDEGSEKVILPVWHKVSREDVVRFSPLLSDKLAVSTSIGIEGVASQIIVAIQKSDTDSRFPVHDTRGQAKDGAFEWQDSRLDIFSFLLGTWEAHGRIERPDGVVVLGGQKTYSAQGQLISNQTFTNGIAATGAGTWSVEGSTLHHNIKTTVLNPLESPIQFQHTSSAKIQIMNEGCHRTKLLFSQVDGEVHQSTLGEILEWHRA